MQRTFVVRSVVACAIAIVSTGTCAVVSCVDIDSLRNGVRPTTDGSPVDNDTSTDQSDAADPCAHVQPVLAPTVDDEPGKELPGFVLAMEAVTIDLNKITSFDLDGVCTCDVRPASAFDGGRTCTNAKQSGALACDLDGGADNAVGIVAEKVRPLIAIDSVPNTLIRKGRRSVLVQLRKYNGRANDPEVDVGAFMSEGIPLQSCPDSGLDSDTQTWSPGGCGDDVWSVAPSAVFGVSGGQILAKVVGRGYVRDYQLVVRFANPAILPFNSASTIRFNDAFLTGRLVPLAVDLSPRDPAKPPAVGTREERYFRLENAILAGRLVASEMLATLGTYQNVTGGNRLCTNAAFESVRDMICGAADILQSPPNFTGPCDSLSAAFGFTATPALMGGAADAALPPTGCESVDASCP